MFVCRLNDCETVFNYYINKVVSTDVEKYEISMLNKHLLKINICFFLLGLLGGKKKWSKPDKIRIHNFSYPLLRNLFWYVVLLSKAQIVLYSEC